MRKGVVLLLILLCAGCSQSPEQAAPAATAAVVSVTPTARAVAVASDTPGAVQEEALHATLITVTPSLGYGGTYVSVSGIGWPAAASVQIGLADQRGRSPALATITADATGHFTTGFVYPISERWLQPGSATVVAQTQDNKFAATATFMVVAPEWLKGGGPTPVPPAAVSPTAAATAGPVAGATVTIPFSATALAPVVVATATPAPTVTPNPTATRIPAASATPQPAPTIDGSAINTIDDLLAAIKRMPASAIDPELANSLTKKLTNAQKQAGKKNMRPVVNMLRAFEHEVEAQRGKKITEDAAAFLLAATDRVIAHLEQEPQDQAGRHEG